MDFNSARMIYVFSPTDGGEFEEMGYIAACNILNLDGAWYAHLYGMGDLFFDSKEQATEYVRSIIGKPPYVLYQ